MEQKRKTEKKPPKRDDKEFAIGAKDLRNPELDEEVADLLDAIDDVLEENAEEFVSGYVQKGGQ